MYKDYTFEIKMVLEQWLQQKWYLSGVLKRKLLSRGGTNIWWSVIKIWFGEPTAGAISLVGGWVQAPKLCAAKIDKPMSKLL